jgi:hypothetical protein
MRVISVRGPYATAIFEKGGPRRLETRAWQTNLRGPTAIVFDNHVIGVVEIVDVHQTGQDACADACDPIPGGATGELVSASHTRLFHWVIANPRRLPDGVSFPYGGFIGIGYLPVGFAAALEHALDQKEAHRAQD